MKAFIILADCSFTALFKSCLKSIYEHTQKILFVITIIDNASYDNSRPIVLPEFSGLQLIGNSANPGFRCGNNLYHSRQLCYYRKHFGRQQSGIFQLCHHAMGKLQCP